MIIVLHLYSQPSANLIITTPACTTLQARGATKAPTQWIKKLPWVIKTSDSEDLGKTRAENANDMERHGNIFMLF